MAQIIKLEHPFEVEAEKFLSYVREGDVTHGVMVYRLKDGSIGYTYLGGEHKTYLAGLMERIKHRLIQVANDYDDFEGDE